MKLLLPLLLLPIAAHAGPYSPAVGLAGSDAIAATDLSLALWADNASVERGPIDITIPDGALASHGSAADATGPADVDLDFLDTYPVVSLGDGGRATLTFSQPLADGPGPDLAVFENSINDTFLELAFVEVSSDGSHFARFPAVSLTPVDLQVGSFAGVDTTDIHNLAGKYKGGYGTPFDLADINDPNLNTAAITHVRVIDVVGTIAAPYASTDSAGNIINDPYRTNFTSGGFDLDAVGAMHPAPGLYAGWSQLYFGVPNAPFAGDSDRDGLSEGLEWALWCNPHRASSPLKLSPSASGFVLRFPFHASRTPGILRIEAGTGLGAWTTIAALGPSGWTSSVSGISVSTDGGFPATISVESSSPSLFRYFRCSIAP